MTQQIIDICGEPHILSNKPVTQYKFYCVMCGARGITLHRDFVCHTGKTRITLDDGDE